MSYLDPDAIYGYSEPCLELSQIYNTNTLNIFCDASMTGANSKSAHGCYGSVAVSRDDILDGYYRISSFSTNNECEIKAMRSALILADKWKQDFPLINIFSDSQISVFGLREYIYKWKYNKKEYKLYNSSGSPVANQSIFVECHYLLMDLAQKCKICIYHQSGHVTNGYFNLKEAGYQFMKSNYVNGVLDLNLIRYISTYNNYIDSTTRSLLRRTNLKEIKRDPIIFIPKGRIYKS